MNKVLFTFLALLSVQSFAGGTSEEVQLLSLVEISNEKYVLQYKSTRDEKTYTINLSYSSLEYTLKARFLTKEKYVASINLLKEQLNRKKDVRFGWFGGGPCPVQKEKNIYRSDALEIYNEGYPDKGPQVVYAFCEYS